MAYQSVNPFDNKLCKSFEELTDAELESKIATASACYETWRQTTYADRSVIVAKAAAIMYDDVDRFARLMTLEMGKRINEARGEVTFSAQILAYYAKNAQRFLARVNLNPTIGHALHGEQSDRSDFRRRAVELSLLSVSACRRSSYDGRQHASW